MYLTITAKVVKAEKQKDMNGDIKPIARISNYDPNF